MEEGAELGQSYSGGSEEQPVAEMRPVSPESALQSWRCTGL